MIKILFVCHGNICRSVMAEYICKYYITEKGISNRFFVESKATSTEEIGNDIYSLAKDELLMHNIPFEKHKARQAENDDISYFDYIICMEKVIIRNRTRMFGPSEKYGLLLDFMSLHKEIEDSWYTGNFNKVYLEIEGAIKALIDILEK